MRNVLIVAVVLAAAVRFRSPSDVVGQPPPPAKKVWGLVSSSCEFFLVRVTVELFCGLQMEVRYIIQETHQEMR